MNAPRPSNTRPCARAAVLAVVTLATACASPLGGRDLDLGLSAQALPGVGAGLSIAQRMGASHGTRYDFEAGVDRQEIADESHLGNDWKRLWAGVRVGADEPGDQWQGRLGLNWFRTEGQVGTLSNPGDYGGGYAGVGYVWALAPSLSAGPEVNVMVVDSEGTRSGSGAVLELAWRWVWHL